MQEQASSAPSRSILAFAILCCVLTWLQNPIQAVAADQIAGVLIRIENTNFSEDLLRELVEEVDAISNAEFKSQFSEPLLVNFADQGSDFPTIALDENCESLLNRPTEDFIRPIRGWHHFLTNSFQGLELNPIFAQLLKNPDLLDKQACTKVKPSRDYRRNYVWYDILLAKIYHGLAWYEYERNGPHHRDPRLKGYFTFFHKENDMISQRAKFIPTLRTRFPISPREFESAREQYATWSEQFWLTNDFHCWRPGIYRYFQKLYPDAASRRNQCVLDDTNLLMGSKLLGKKHVVRFDASKVWRAFYVEKVPFKGPVGAVFSKGHSLITAFGHSMIRVVLCESDDPAEQGPHCAFDRIPDVIISFNNNLVLRNVWGEEGVRRTEEEEEDATVIFGGFTGSLLTDILLIHYEARETMDLEFYKHYEHYPLRMSREEIQTMLSLSLELYDHYFGRWHNLASNCSVNIWRLLHASMERDPLKGGINEGKLYPHFTPSGLILDLRRAGTVEEPMQEVLTFYPHMHWHPELKDKEVSKVQATDLDNHSR